MTISTGERVPDVSFMKMGETDPEDVPGEALFAGRRVAIFAGPGAFTAGCSSAHLPSIMRSADRLKAAGIDDVVFLTVNDPFVMGAWDEASGASGAGVRLLADPAGAFTRAIGMDLDIPARGLIGRSRRYSMLVDDGVVAILNIEPGRECSISAGETLLYQITDAPA